ncbi:MAG: hypothetical protein EOP10_17330 [Proteobacteria bacterium]|nr:MAG: hypothetical protein EOP10_17330 [Pseudomonadota bacterium]
MIRYVLIGACLLTGCKTVANRSSTKSLVESRDRTLIAKMTVDVSRGEPISLIVDTVTDRPSGDARLFVRQLTVKVSQVDSYDLCTRPMLGVETNGEQGKVPYFLFYHEEGSRTYIFQNTNKSIPTSFRELLFTFDKGSNKDWASQCNITVVADGFWSAVGDIGYDVVSDDPKRDAAIREFGSSLDHRISHYMWHTSRGAWPSLQGQVEVAKAKNSGPSASENARKRLALLEKSIEQYRSSGWEPPRYFRATEKETAASGAGEDFLFMHRQMLNRLSAYLEDRALPMIPAWKTLPKPDDEQYPVGPKGSAELGGVKSTEYFYATQSILEKAYQSRTVDLDALAKDLHAYRMRTKADNQNPTLAEARAEVEQLMEPIPGLKYIGLKGLSLSDYGHLLEMTIHDGLHARYAFNGAARPADADPLDRSMWTKEWIKAYGDTSYDWLTDTFSSHVHPWFYRIHGWVDNRINDWLAANDYRSIGSKAECAQAVQPCYVWLSDSRYVNKGSDEPWEGPVVAESSTPSGTMSLHAHKAPVFTPDVVEATKGLRAPYATFSRTLVNPKLVH